jgi:hypothetical protein
MGDMLEMYGFDIQELNPWQNLAEHVATQVKRGNPVLVELDSWYLPDTAGSSYKTEHVKSTVAVNSINLQQKTMGYFHGQGYYELQGEDFDHIFQLQGLVHERMLPPYIELIKLRSRPDSLTAQELLGLSRAALCRQLVLMPRENPFVKFKERFSEHLPVLMEAGMDTFHKYSFATFRQFGACFELAATYLQWLQERDDADLDKAIRHYLFIAESVKAIQFQFARAMARKKVLELDLLDQMSDAWQQSRDLLTANYLAK